MDKQYLNPPIIEAVCELLLTPDTKWDLTIPGLIYEKIKNSFPNKEQRIVSQFVTPNIISEEHKVFQQQVFINELALFRSEDGKQLIQVGKRLLSVNHLKPYKSWNEFEPLIVVAFEALKQVTDFSEIQRIGLRYINRIDIPYAKIDLDDYLEFKPSLGKNWPDTLAGFVVECSLPYYNGRDVCKAQLTNAISEDKNASLSFLLDLDYFLNHPKAIARDHILEWIDKAHEEIQNVFEGCITDNLRRLFDEVR